MEEIRNLPATERVTGTEELSQATSTQANTDTEEVSFRQASSIAPLLRRGLGRRSHCSEREDSGSSHSSQEDSHSVRSTSRSRSSRRHSPAPSRCTRTRRRTPCRHSSHSRTSSRASHVSGGHSRSPLDLVREAPEGPPTFVSSRTLSSASVGRAPQWPSPSAAFVTPVMLHMHLVMGPPPPPRIPSLPPPQTPAPAASVHIFALTRVPTSIDRRSPAWATCPPRLLLGLRVWRLLHWFHIEGKAFLLRRSVQLTGHH